ncbi:hypothetical protein FIBSPDRAFT_657372, partial [Athelia psychrophila]
LTVKCYAGISKVLGMYNDQHIHPTGHENARFTRLAHDTRIKIAEQLRLGVSHKRIVSNLSISSSTKPNSIISCPIFRETTPSRDNFITSQDIRRIERGIEAETVCLHPDDGKSSLQWVDRMRAAGELLGFKGCPVAWMISTSATEVTIDYFLQTFKDANPGINPSRFMTDFDWAQINSIRRQYPNAQIYICWWHVLHAWQQRFTTQHHPELWGLLKGWIRLTTDEEFSDCWAKIQALAPKSFLKYIEVYWLPWRAMWSAIARVGRSIFEQSDTNMLVEAYVVPYFHAKHYRQLWGFEGPDLEGKRRDTINKLAQSIPPEHVEEVDEEGQYLVCSQSSPGHKYTVDIDDYTCDCDSYPLIDFCKHLAAVQLHFFEGVEVRDLASLFIPTKPSADPLTASRQPLREPSTTPPPVISDISDRLQRLAIRYLASPPSILSDCLRRLDTLLDRALAECGQSQVLPAPQRIVPNQHSWPETAATMIGAVKNKRKSKH